ncbi:MAG: hypothetical protein B7X93_12560 [Hydrogenophilales bacterium 17-61-9]|nr:MAG: hypothetical protein B7X93_12560 [Hydrogenophilales bacterium 17-61-9]
MEAKITIQQKRRMWADAEMQAMRTEDEKLVRSWTPEEAKNAALTDARNYRIQTNDIEREGIGSDIVTKSTLNSAYKKAFEVHAPEILKQTTAKKDLANNIKNNLAEPQHRFELQDPFMETKYRFPTAAEATTQADKFGFVGIVSVAPDGKTSQVLKCDGEWRKASLRDGEWIAAGKSIADIQAGIDKVALKAIQDRAELRAAAGQGVGAEIDKAMATADAHAFRRIQALPEQESAAVTMADIARQSLEYKNALDKAIPGYPGTAAKVYALDAAHDAKIAAKEERKGKEYADMVAGREERAKNCPRSIPPTS